MATYLILDLIILAALALVAVHYPFRLSRRWLVTLVGLLILTLVFDNLIILCGIVTYDPSKILGIRIGSVPIEDFAYTLAASILIPAYWHRGDHT